MLERRSTSSAADARASCHVSGLAPGEVPLASRLLARAFRDNPGILTVLPGTSAEARQRALEQWFPGFLRSMLRYGCVETMRREGEIAGVAMTYAPHTFPPPVFATLLQAPGPLRAGLLTTWRLMRADRAMHQFHPRF